MNFFQEHLFLIQSQFHWLRPYWLFTLIPAVLLIVFLWRQKRQSYQWQQLVSPELLPFLIDGKTTQTKKSLLWVLLITWFISAIAMAGPSWVKRPTPVEKNQNTLVILLDLSYSMISEDIKPSRIARARLKIADILRERKDGQTALVAYAGEAHTVTPLSDDNSTIVSLLSSMHPNVMPLQGSNTEAAVERGLQLLNDAGATQGDLLLVTDGVVPEAFSKIRTLLANKKIHLDILGVGTTQAAPIPNANGGFLQDNSGKIITTQLNSAELTQLAQSLNSRYHELVNSNADIEYLKSREYKDSANTPKIQRDFDQWVDNGYWFVFLLLPIALFCFRRGVLLSILLIPLLGFSPSKSYAFGWDDLWLTKDQQAQRELKSGDAKKASEHFESPDWKASAQYRAGDYAASAESFSAINTASGHYNRGNALAKAGKLHDAIKAYDEALKRDPSMEDAKKNRELVEKLRKQQEQNKSDQNEDKKNENQEKKDENQKDQENNSDQKNEQNENQKNENQQKNDESANNSSAQSNKDSQRNSQSSSSTGDQPNNADQQKSQEGAKSSTSQAGQSSSAGMQQQTSHASSGGSSSQAPQTPIEQNNLTDEQKQALEQWLRRVPDDPGGLLRNKFKYQYEQNRLKERNGESTSPENNADQRL